MSASIGSVRPSYAGDLRAAIARYLPHKGLPLVVEGDAKLRWTPRMLVVQALLMAFCVGDTLGSCFAGALETLVGMYPSRKRPGGDCNGFMRRLAREGQGLLDLIKPHLRGHVRRIAGGDAEAPGHWTVAGWLCFGVDGSKQECPMSPRGWSGTSDVRGPGGANASICWRCYGRCRRAGGGRACCWPTRGSRATSSSGR